MRLIIHWIRIQHNRFVIRTQLSLSDWTVETISAIVLTKRVTPFIRFPWFSFSLVTNTSLLLRWKYEHLLFLDLILSIKKYSSKLISVWFEDETFWRSFVQFFQTQQELISCVKWYIFCRKEFSQYWTQKWNTILLQFKNIQYFF